MKNEQFIITGMTCTSCSANITKQVQKLNGVENVNVSLLANKMSVTYDESETDSSKIISAVVSVIITSVTISMEMIALSSKVGMPKAKKLGNCTHAPLPTLLKSPKPNR